MWRYLSEFVGWCVVFEYCEAGSSEKMYVCERSVPFSVLEFYVAKEDVFSLTGSEIFDGDLCFFVEPLECPKVAPELISGFSGEQFAYDDRDALPLVAGTSFTSCLRTSLEISSIIVRFFGHHFLVS